MRSRVNAQTEALTKRSVLFSCVLGSFGAKKRSKTTKIQEKCKKYAKKFAYIKKNFCTFAPDLENELNH